MAALQDLLPGFQTVGGDLYSHGMVSMHGGNLSVRQDTNLCITRSGSRLGYLDQSDLIQTGINKDDPNTKLASSELAVHRAIYRKTPFAAVVHCHPIHAVVLSFLRDKIVPSDEAGKLFIPVVPVIGFGIEPVPGGFPQEIAEVLNSYPVVIVHGHGSFARGMTLAEAYAITELLEISCRILYLLKK
ncbi:MAG: class II aldolase/adducin family protein [Chloroflexi bacterium]|nr:class II aldolase/adducin family protein [Chloroflexota bacterium]